MNEVLATVMPLFGLIALGFVAARLKMFPAEGASGLSRFAFDFAIPALLFRNLVHVDQPQASPVLLWATYYGALAITWVLASGLATQLSGFGSRSAAVAAMASCFSNLVFLVLPLSVGAFGSDAALPAALIVAVNTPLLWFCAMLQMEWGNRASGAPFGRLLGDLARSLLKNPIILALIAGAGWRASGIALPTIPDQFLALLGDCAVPVALFALGLSLSTYGLGEGWQAAALLVALKLAVFPVIVWLIGSAMPGLPPAWLRVAVLMAACPAGVNAFLLAMRYQRGVATVAAAIALGTAVSAFTLTVLLYWLRS
jgi:malonate transporter and related proteins